MAASPPTSLQLAPHHRGAQARAVCAEEPGWEKSPQPFRSGLSVEEPSILVPWWKVCTGASQCLSSRRSPAGRRLGTYPSSVALRLRVKPAAAVSLPGLGGRHSFWLCIHTGTSLVPSSALPHPTSPYFSGLSDSDRY